jgi:hypothetical protein
MANLIRVPGNFPTLRCTTVRVTFEGGLFVLSLEDMRAISNAPIDQQPSDVGAFEVGRFALSPVTLQWLEQAIAQARTAYERAMGHPLPDPARLQDALNADAIAEDLRNQQRGGQGPHPDS